MAWKWSFARCSHPYSNLSRRTSRRSSSLSWMRCAARLSQPTWIRWLAPIVSRRSRCGSTETTWRDHGSSLHSSPLPELILIGALGLPRFSREPPSNRAWNGWRARCSVATLLSEVKEATRRISELVAAVRSYTQMDRASMQHIDVTDGLDSTLVMLGHKLRGVTVVREYGTDVPMIDAYAGELNQVWTNLIDNAVDAMDGSGTLRVATRVEEGEVVIEIGDNGSRHAAGGSSPRVRGLLHDKGRWSRHRPGP